MQSPLSTLQQMPLSDLRENFTAKLRPVVERDARLLVTQRGHPLVVVLSVADFEAIIRAAAKVETPRLPRA